MTEDMVMVKIRHEDQEARVWCRPEQARIGQNIEVNILDGLWEIIEVMTTLRVD